MILGSSSLLEKSGHLHPLSLKEPPLDFQRVRETRCETGESVVLGLDKISFDVGIGSFF